MRTREPIRTFIPPDPGGGEEPERGELAVTAGMAAMADELERGRSRYQRLVETVPAAICVLDADGCVLEINPAGLEILGRPEAEVVGVGFPTFIAPEDAEAADLLFRARLSGPDTATRTELHVVRPSGERRLLRVSTSPVQQDVDVPGLYCAALDITEEHAREAQLRRSERMASVGPLLRGICHELNNPLTSIKSFAELLLLDERSPEDREALEIVLREAERASRTISDLRLVARQTQEGGGRGMVDLNQVIRTALALRAPQLDAARTEVRLELEEPLPRVWASAGQMEQVVTNLVVNAEQAMDLSPAGAILTVRTFVGDRGVTVDIADNGCGIAPGDLDRIFDPFWTTRPAGSGSGLGLSLVNSIMSDHGGRIRVKSRPGRGTRVSFDLPAVERPPVVGGEGDEALVTARRLRLLVVDDEPSIRQSLARYLGRRGHHVEMAEDGRAALDRLEAEPGNCTFDLVLADFWMPSLSGDALYETLRERGHDAARRIVFMTGDANSPEIRRLLEKVDLTVVEKPFELAEVAQIIEFQVDLLASDGREPRG